MTATLQLSANPLDQLRATVLAPYAGIYEGYLSEGGYAPSTKGGYFRCLTHFRIFRHSLGRILDCRFQ